MSPQRVVTIGMLVALSGLVASAAGMWWLRTRGPGSIRAPIAAPGTGGETGTGLVMPAFALVDQDGAPIDAGVLDGGVTVVDFFFTSCPLYCPGMTAAMRRVQEATADVRGADGTAGVRLLSISIDGEHDTPEVIRAYAAGFGADFSRWVFATGPREAVWGMLREGLTLHVGEDEGMPITRPDGSGALNIDHPTRLLLVGPDRRVLGLFAYDDGAAVTRLIDEARALAGG